MVNEMSKVLKKLCLHAGGCEVDYDELKNVPTPVLHHKSRYELLSHANLVDMTKQQLEAADYEIVNEQHAVNKFQYFGILQIASKNNDYATIVGLRNSYDNTLPAGIVTGSGVFVCDNLAFNGEYRISKKHYTGLNEELPVLLADIIANIGGVSKQIDTTFNTYKALPVSDQMASHIIVKAFQSGIINTRQIETVIDQCHNPAHNEHLKDGRTLYTVFNGFTEALKPKNPTALFALPALTQSVHKLCDETVLELQAA